MVSQAQKTAWLPPGDWFDALTGKITSVKDPTGTPVTRGYTLGEVPMWFKAGAIIPYLPLKSLPSLVGVAVKQYSFLGFRLVPGGPQNTSTAVYEDDGSTTAYLNGNAHVWTTCNSTVTSDGGMVVTIVSTASGNSSSAVPYEAFPDTRAYQIRLPNRAPPSTVSVGGQEMPFVRFGAVLASRTTPPTNQWYYSFEEDEGLGQ